MSIKAFALHTIHRRDEKNNKQVVDASSAGKPSVFETDQEEFDKLERLGAVRKATREEIMIAKANSDAANGIPASKSAPAETEETDPADQTAPNSGAKGDPKGTSKNTKKVVEDEI